MSDIIPFQKDIEYTHEILEDIYLKVLEAIPEAVLVINENFKIVVFNTKAELLFGYSRVEVITEPITNLINFGERTKYLYMLKNYIIDPLLVESATCVELVTGLTRFDREISLNVKMNSFVIAKAGIHILLLLRRI